MSAGIYKSDPVLGFHSHLCIVGLPCNMLTRPILYGSDISPAVRTVLLTAKFIGLEFDYRYLGVYHYFAIYSRY